MRYSILLFAIITTRLLSQNSLDTQVNDLCNQIAKEMSEYRKTTIAVIEFSDLDGNTTDLGKFLSEEVITKLFQTKKFKVIERQLLNKVIKEQKLQVSGILDEMSAKKLGKLLGVNAIVSGTVAELATSVKINARLIGTETGEIFGAASTEIEKDESIQRLLRVQQTETNETTSNKAAQPPQSIQSVSAKGFTFQLVKCQRKSANTIVIELLIINTEEDQELSLYAQHGSIWVMGFQEPPNSRSARIFDVNGNEYLVNEIQIGTKKADDRNKEVRGKFLSNVPIRTTLKFKDIPSEVDLITSLDLGIVTDWNKYNVWHAQFKNIKIHK